MGQVEDQSPSHPADRPLVTFDNNIVILLRNNDTDAQPAHQLLALSRAGMIIAGITLSTALEKQRPDQRLGMHEYAVCLQEQGFTPDYIFTGPQTVGFHVPGTSPNTIPFDVGLERVHHILFPTTPFSWVEFRDREYKQLGRLGTRRAALLELESLRWDQYIPPSPQAPATRPTPLLNTLEQMERDELWVICENLHRKWAKRKNDALGFYAHLTQSLHTPHPEHSVFVTNDGKFHQKSKRAALRKLGFPGEILRPVYAVTFICKVTGTPAING